VLGRVAETRNAAIGTVACAVLFAVAFHQSQRQSATCSRARPSCAPIRATTRTPIRIVEKFDLARRASVVVETPKDGCYDYPTSESTSTSSGGSMANVPGVVSVASAPLLAKLAFSGFNEGNPKWATLPRDPKSLANYRGPRTRRLGPFNPAARAAGHLYLADHKADHQGGDRRDQGVFAGERRSAHQVRARQRNVGVQAATNEVPRPPSCR